MLVEEYWIQTDTSKNLLEILFKCHYKQPRECEIVSNGEIPFIKYISLNDSKRDVLFIVLNHNISMAVHFESQPVYVFDVLY